MLKVWDTSDVAHRESFAHWRESVTQAYLPLEPEPQSGAGFHGRIVRNGCNRLKVSRVSSVARTTYGIARRANGDFFANILMSGSVVVRQGNRITTAKAGDVILVDTDEAFSLNFSEGVDVVCVAFDGAVLRRMTTRGDHSPHLVLPRQAAGRLVAAYIAGLAEDLETIGSIADLAADQFPALVSRAALQIEPANLRLVSLAARIQQSSKPKSAIDTWVQSGSQPRSACRAAWSMRPWRRKV